MTLRECGLCCEEFDFKGGSLMCSEECRCEHRRQALTSRYKKLAMCKLPILTAAHQRVNQVWIDGDWWYDESIVCAGRNHEAYFIEHVIDWGGATK